MVTTTAFIYAQNPNAYVSGTSTIDINETASLAIPNGGRGVVWIGVPTITSANLTFTVQPYPGATFRTLQDASGATVTVTASTGGFTIAVPQLTGCFAFTIVSTQTQLAARAFQINCIGGNPALALTNTSQSVTNQYQTAISAKPDVTAGTAWATANTGLTLFTVTGTVKARVYGVGGATPMTSTGGTGTLAVGVTGATGALLPATTANGTSNFVANCAWVDATPTVTAELLPNTGNFVLVTGNILLAIVTNNMTAGSMTLYCEWLPVSSDGLVVAA